MMARTMRLLWLAAGAVALIAAAQSVHLVGARIGAWAAALAGIAAVAALHPLVLLCNFVVSRALGDAVPRGSRLTWWGAIRTFDAEVDASMRGVWFATPFAAHRAAPRPVDGALPRPWPILLIHGYVCNRAVWSSFMRDAARRGYRCEAVTLADPFAAIDRQCDAVAAAIDDLLATTRAAGLAAERVVVVGHSMGGLVARELRLHAAGARIAHTVTLGTPHHGTASARLAVSPSGRQMRRGSAWLAGLAVREASGLVPIAPDSFTSLFSHHDDIVYPQRTAALEGSHCIAIGGVGHVALLYDRRVRTLVFERLAAVEAAVDGIALADAMRAEPGGSPATVRA